MVSDVRSQRLKTEADPGMEPASYASASKDVQILRRGLVARSRICIIKLERCIASS